MEPYKVSQSSNFNSKSKSKSKSCWCSCSTMMRCLSSFQIDPPCRCLLTLKCSHHDLSLTKPVSITTHQATCTACLLHHTIHALTEQSKGSATDPIPQPSLLHDCDMMKALRIPSLLGVLETERTIGSSGCHPQAGSCEHWHRWCRSNLATLLVA
jgi:hypothetical protein